MGAAAVALLISLTASQPSFALETHQAAASEDVAELSNWVSSVGRRWASLAGPLFDVARTQTPSDLATRTYGGDAERAAGRAELARWQAAFERDVDAMEADVRRSAIPEAVRRLAQTDPTLSLAAAEAIQPAQLAAIARLRAYRDQVSDIVLGAIDGRLEPRTASRAVMHSTMREINLLLAEGGLSGARLDAAPDSAVRAFAGLMYVALTSEAVVHEASLHVLIDADGAAFDAQRSRLLALAARGRDEISALRASTAALRARGGPATGLTPEQTAGLLTRYEEMLPWMTAYVEALASWAEAWRRPTSEAVMLNAASPPSLLDFAPEELRRSLDQSTPNAPAH